MFELILLALFGLPGMLAGAIVALCVYFFQKQRPGSALVAVATGLFTAFWTYTRWVAPNSNGQVEVVYIFGVVLGVLFMVLVTVEKPAVQSASRNQISQVNGTAVVKTAGPSEITIEKDGTGYRITVLDPVTGNKQSIRMS